ncbi:MAG: hypothetical protein A4E38_01673 [Methanoregulaceae archaeon PtaB.Bin108]|nr:MAG: hypothetical protein A4E38_01673 [Methanoregulaceae archaeon PtaB.Bin108]
MNPLRIIQALFLLTILFLPVLAGHPIENITLIPGADSLPEGLPVNLSATIRIIPPGPTTTFVEWDELVLSTELDNPHWDIAAIADQRRVAVTPAEGQVVKVPGYLLSYSPDRQVSVSVSLGGTVPSVKEPRSFVVLSVDEQNDRGVSVYGSADNVSRTAIPFTWSQPSTTPSPTQAAISSVAVLAALLGFFVLLWGKTH